MEAPIIEHRCSATRSYLRIRTDLCHYLLLTSLDSNLFDMLAIMEQGHLVSWFGFESLLSLALVRYKNSCAFRYVSTLFTIFYSHKVFSVVSPVINERFYFADPNWAGRSGA